LLTAIISPSPTDGLADMAAVADDWRSADRKH